MDFQMVWAGSVYPWELTAIILLSISFTFSAIAYMLSSIFKSEGLKRFARSEFLVALSTLFLVASIIFAVNVLEEKISNLAFEILKVSDPSYAASVSAAKTAGQKVTIFSYPTYYLDKVIDCVRVSWARVICINFPADVISEFSGENVATVTNIIRDMMREANSSLSYLLFMLYLQKHLLIFSAQTMLTVFLPIGIICRAFPLTRGLGNTFIAIAVGFYFVFPLSYYLVLATMYAPEIDSKCQITSSTQLSYLGGCMGVFMGSTIVNLLPTNMFDILVKSILNINPSNYVRLITGSMAFTGAALYYKEVIVGIIAEINIFAIIYPLVAVAITLTFVRSFAILIGTRADDLVQGIIRLI